MPYILPTVKATLEAFFQQEKPWAKGRNKGGSLFFDGPTLYSYGAHFPLAYITSQGHVYINLKPSSKTTSKHRNMVKEMAGSWYDMGELVKKPSGY